MIPQNRTATLKRASRLSVFLILSAVFALAQSPDTLANRIQKIMDRPEFAHAHFGIKFGSLDSGRVLYQFNSDKLMVPGSTTKLLTEGTVLEVMGGDYRFHTRVYRTGEIKRRPESLGAYSEGWRASI